MLPPINPEPVPNGVPRVNSPEPSRPRRGILACIVGAALLIAPVVCWPDAESSLGVQAALALVSFSCAAAGLYFVVRRRAISPANLLLAMGSVILCLAIVEAALAIASVTPLKRIVWRVPELAPWWDVERSRIDAAKYTGPWRINAAGFPDSDEFDDTLAESVPRRILLVGDSFAFGAGASGPDTIFPHVLDRALDAAAETVVWNASIPGTGQATQYQLLREFLPKLRPQVVVITLYRNDFNENLLPLDRFYVFEDGNWVDRYEGSPLGRMRALSPSEAYRRAFAPQSAQDWLKASRTASAAASLIRRIFPNRMNRPMDVRGTGSGYDATRRLLGEIRDVCVQSKTKLVVLLIPDRDDLARHADALRLTDELGLTHIDVRAALTDADYAPRPDTHWNDRGHAAVAAVVARELIAGWPGSEVGGTAP